jgi:hypothetical protein
MTGSPSLARLRAAEGVLSQVEAGIRDSKISADKAALMLEFCSWACSGDFDGNEEAKRRSLALLERLSAFSPPL